MPRIAKPNKQKFEKLKNLEHMNVEQAEGGGH